MNSKTLLAILTLGLIGGGLIISAPALAFVTPAFSNNYQISFTGTNTNPDADIIAGNVYAVYERAGNIYFKENRGVEKFVAVGTSPDIAVDGAGTANVVYLNSGNVMFTRLTIGASDWTTPAALDVGTYATIAVDSSNNVYIAYSLTDGDGYSDIFYSKNGAVGTMIANGQNDGGIQKNYTNPVIKIDSNGKYHVACLYTAYVGDPLTDAQYIQVITNAADGNSLSADLGYSTTGILSKNSLALDGSNNAYVVYSANGSKVYRAIVTTTGSWDNIQVSINGTDASIFINGTTIGVSYYSAGYMKYQEDTGSGFVLTNKMTADAGSKPVVLLGSGSKYVYYENSGNIYLATDQTMVDANPPVVSGVAENGIYKTVTITFSDDETTPPSATLNGIAFVSGTTVNTEGAYVLTVSDGTPANDVTIHFIIDLTPPTINGTSTDIIAEATNPSGATVTYTAPTATDTVDGTDTVVCLPASGSIFALGSATVTCNSTDVAGNTATPTTFTVTVQDTTPPAITLNGSNPQQIQINNAYTELGAVVTDNYDTGLTATIDSSAVITTALGSYSVTYNVTDSHSNVATTVTRTVNVVDGEAPSTNDNVPSAWQTADTTITFTCTDNVACSKVYYTTDGNTPVVGVSNFVDVSSGSGNFVISTDGTYTIKYFGVDTSDNAETVRTATNALLLDKMAPTTSDDYGAKDKIWQSASQTITLTPVDADPSSGLNYTKYCTDSTNTCDPASGTDYTAPVAISADGTTYFRYASKDNAGNIQTTVSRAVMIDTNPAVITGVTDGTTYTSAITVTFSNGTALLSGPSESTPTSPFTVSTNGAWILTVTDLAGQEFVINFTMNIPHSGGGPGPTPPPVATTIVGDANGDNKVNEYDFALLMSQWGQTGTNLSADLNKDGVVNMYDFALLMLNWSL